VKRKENPCGKKEDEWTQKKGDDAPKGGQTGFRKYDGTNIEKNQKYVAESARPRGKEKSIRRSKEGKKDLQK